VQAAAAQVLDDLNQVLGGAAQPVEPPDDDGIPRSRVRQQFFPTGLVGLHAGNGVRIDVVAAGVAQGIELQVEHLFLGADASVTEFLHGRKRISGTRKKQKANLRYLDCGNQFRVPPFAGLAA